MGLEGKSETKVSLKGTILTNQQVFDMIEKHKNNTENPHGVTAEQLIGLVPIEKGGTGGTTTLDAVENLGLAAEMQWFGEPSSPLSKEDFISSVKEKAFELSQYGIPVKFPITWQGIGQGYAEVFRFTSDMLYLTMYVPSIGTRTFVGWGNGLEWGEISKTPCVTESGTSGAWTYRKWSDGTYECWRKDTITMDITTAWGTGLYTSGDWLAGNFPVTFTDIPHCIYSISTHGYSVIAMSGASKPTTTTLPKIQFARAHSTPGSPIEVNWYVKGTVAL